MEISPNTKNSELKAAWDGTHEDVRCADNDGLTITVLMDSE